MTPAQRLALADLAALGPFFALGSQPADAPGWTPVCALIEDPARTDAAIDEYAARLGSDRRDIAGSLLVQGWAGRLTSIFACCVVLAGAAPDLAACRLRYRLIRGAPVALAVNKLTGGLAVLDAEQSWRRLVDDHLEPLINAVHRRCRAPRRQLWGNTASALAGSLTSLAAAGLAPLGQLRAAAWAQPPELAALGSWVESPRGLRFVRRSCCGIIRIPGHGTCADCCIDGQQRAVGTADP